jgi:hypothetical protein
MSFLIDLFVVRIYSVRFMDEIIPDQIWYKTIVSLRNLKLSREYKWNSINQQDVSVFCTPLFQIKQLFSLCLMDW